MSNTQFAFLMKDQVPNRSALQASIDSLDFNLQLDPEFTPFEDEGFSPCNLNGNDDVGFEIYYEPASDIVEDDEDFQNIVSNKDYCISMCWGGEMADCVSVLIVSCALAKDFGAIISYEGEEPESLEEMINSTRKVINSL